MNNIKPKVQFGHKDKQPWYKNYMVIIFVIGLPLFVVIACIWFVFYSVQIKDSVVRDDWYMDGKTLYQDISRDKLAHDLDLSGEMTFNDDEIIFNLIYPTKSIETGKFLDGTTLYYPDELSLSISHATDINKDRDATLKHIKGNKYAANIKLDSLESKYYVQVSSEDKLDWRLKVVGKLPAKYLYFEPLKSFD